MSDIPESGNKRPRAKRLRTRKPLRLPEGHESMTLPELLVKMEAKTIDANQVAELLSVAPKTVYRLHEKRCIRGGFHVGTSLRFDTVELARSLE